MVIEDILARKQFGLEKYKTILQADNGRDALMDAYQEAIDLVAYLRQCIEERKNKADNRTTKKLNDLINTKLQPKITYNDESDFKGSKWIRELAEKNRFPKPKRSQSRFPVDCNICNKEIKGHEYHSDPDTGFICHHKCRPRPA